MPGGVFATRVCGCLRKCTKKDPDLGTVGVNRSKRQSNHNTRLVLAMVVTVENLN